MNTSPLLGYCANVHPGETLSDVLGVAERFAGPIRRTLELETLGIGLWLSRSALSELKRTGLGVLRRALERESLHCFTLNGFPYGNFQAAVVKRAVYHPDLGTKQRREYLLELAEVLAALMPPGLSEATISTLPLGHREEATDDLPERALSELCGLAEDLGRLRERTGRSVRVCLEPEPGCFLETTRETVEFFGEALPRAARRHGVSVELVREQLGVCFDCCHQAVAFEQARESLAELQNAGIVVGKVQLSSALVVPDPAASEGLLERFDEPRFLHQVRTRLDDGSLAKADDLPLTGALPRDREWRVHFHVPIHRDVVGEVRTTRGFLDETLLALSGWHAMPGLEVETYTWSVLPENERPKDDASLVSGIAAELAWVMQRLRTL